MKKWSSRSSLVLVMMLIGAAPLRAQCPGFPARGVQIIDALFNPALAMGTDDQRRSLTRTFIEQLVFESPSDGWTWKSADPGRPPSKDSIARLVNGRLCNWDWQNGSTRQRSVQVGQAGDDITGQNPLPIAGVNHLSDTPGPGPGPVPIPQPVATLDLSAVFQRLDQVDAHIERAYLDVRAAESQLASQVVAVDDHLTRIDNDPGWLKKVLTNPIVLTTITAVGAVLTGRYAVPNK